MKRIAFGVLVLTASRCAVFSQVAVDPARLEQVRLGGQSLRERLKPHQLNPKTARRLFDHVLSYGGQVESTDCAECAVHEVKRERRNSDGSTETLSMSVTELPYEEPARETESGMSVRNLVLRRLFDSRFTVQSIRSVPMPDGKSEEDIWTYTVSTEGVLLEVEHRLQTAVRLVPTGLGPLAGVVMGETYGIVKPSLRVYRMSPRDPWVLNRWKSLSREILRILPVVDA